jgi:hypothetical protein
MKLALIVIAAIFLVGGQSDASPPKEGEPLNLDTKETRTLVETNKMGVSDEEVRSTLKNALRSYFILSKADWTHNYSHVAGMDAGGIIEWPVPEPPVRWRWRLRPGGLAMLTKPDGSTIYLVREKP